MRAIGRLLAVSVIVVVVVAICWVAGCAKKSGREAVPETRDTLAVISDTLSKTHDTLSETFDTLSEISNTLTDKRDGKVYRTVTIGKRTWMAENLNYETSSGSWCYGDKPDSCKKYGRLYDWNTAKTVCPTGWHLPSRAEWDTLARFVGGTKDYSNESDPHHWANAGKYLKSQTGWNAYSGIENLDIYKFSALPGGYRYSHDNYYGNVGYYGNWWTTTEDDGYAYGRGMIYGYDGVNENDNYKSSGFSVRCVGDKNAAR